MSDEINSNNGKTPDSNEDNLSGLLFESSPYGNLDAIVQHDQRAVYFYLSGEESFGTRACWVRNLVHGPLVLNQEDLQTGRPPVMPRIHCCNPKGLPIPNAEDLKIVWFEEGNGAALFEDNELIAVIPPWSGIDGFHGYSIECASENPLAWPLPDHDQLRLRIHNAYEFWHACATEESHPYALLQPKILAAYESQLGQQENYFAIDGGQFPPRGAAIYRHEGFLIIASVGMSMRPQPGVELAIEHPRDKRRIELALAIETDNSISELEDVLKQFSGLVSWPWDRYTWFGDGHTCDLDSLTVIPNHPTELRFSDSPPDMLPASPIIEFPEYRDDPVNLLWLVPTGK